MRQSQDSRQKPIADMDRNGEDKLIPRWEIKMIEKVVEFRYSDGRKTSNHYTVYYEHAIRDYNDGNLPNTVLGFILADDGKCKTEYGKDIPVKKTTYTR